MFLKKKTYFIMPAKRARVASIEIFMEIMSMIYHMLRLNALYNTSHLFVLLIIN